MLSTVTKRAVGWSPSALRKPAAMRASSAAVTARLVTSRTSTSVTWGLRRPLTYTARADNDRFAREFSRAEK